MGKLDEKIIVKCLAGECSEEELRSLNVWLEESEENAHELFTLEELYHLGKSDVVSEEALLAKAEKQLSQRLGEERKRKLKRKLFHRWMQYAAIAVGAFFIGGMGYWFYQAGSRSSESLVTVTANETIKELMLPDGTKVWLNKNTILQYPRNFEGGERHVYLNGEGFFDVKRNTAKPFIVQSHAMQVRVLGTTFNLKSGENGQRAVATLLKGEVEVKGNHGEGMIVRRLTVKPAEPGIEGWHDTAFDLNQTDIRTLCKILERAYNVKIIIAPDVNIERTYSGPLKKKENVAATLDLIKNSIGIKYKVIGENVFISSSKAK